MSRAVVVDQLGEWLLPLPEIRGSNPVVGKFYLLSTVLKPYWKDENKAKRCRNWPNLKKNKTNFVQHKFVEIQHNTKFQFFAILVPPKKLHLLKRFQNFPKVKKGRKYQSIDG